MSETPVKPEEKAEEKLGFWATLKLDLREKTVWGVLLATIRRPGSCAVFLFRCSSYFYKKGAFGWFMAMFFSRLNIIFNNCEIQPIATIGPGFRIVHSIGVVMGNAKIGKNFTVYHSITLGRMNHDFRSGGKEIQPELGDDVVVYTGAIILGAVKIGNGARIGANALVVKDVPAGWVAKGAVATIVPPKETAEPAQSLPA